MTFSVGRLVVIAAEQNAARIILPASQRTYRDAEDDRGSNCRAMVLARGAATRVAAQNVRAPKRVLNAPGASRRHGVDVGEGMNWRSVIVGPPSICI